MMERAKSASNREVASLHSLQHTGVVTPRAPVNASLLTANGYRAHAMCKTARRPANHHGQHAMIYVYISFVLVFLLTYVCVYACDII